ncbi:MAG: phage holin family protein [Clostridia bacterium]|nr:phage holin family protein [Clostridia bacterium]
MNWEKIWDKAVCLTAAVGGGIAGAFGGWDTLLAVLTGMMAADYISGLAVAAMGRSLKTVYGGLSSKVGAMGLAKKGLMLLCVLVAAMLDRAMGADHAVCRDAVCWFYVANEGLSLLENLSLAGVPFPQKLKQLLGQRMEQAEEAFSLPPGDVYLLEDEASFADDPEEDGDAAGMAGTIPVGRDGGWRPDGWSEPVRELGEESGE